MLLEVKEPSAVIPLLEYERLKKLEDKYLDNIEVIRLSYEDKYNQTITNIVSDDNYKIVLFKKEGNNLSLFQRMSNEDYNRFINKHNLKIERITTLEESQSLYEKVFGKPFEKDTHR